MSEASGSDTTAGTTVYVRLLDEGAPVYRPVHAISVAASTFRLGTPVDYDPADEKWEFVPGTTVLCEAREMGTAHVLVAVRRAGDRTG